MESKLESWLDRNDNDIDMYARREKMSKARKLGSGSLPNRGRSARLSVFGKAFTITVNGIDQSR